MPVARGRTSALLHDALPARRATAAPFGRVPSTLSANLLAGNRAEYSNYAAKTLSEIAAWSYSDFETFKDKVSDKAGTGIDMMAIEVGNEPLLVRATAQILRTRDKKVIIVAFRGTELTNLANWVTDAIAKKGKFFDTNIYVHRGFLANLDCVWLGKKGVLMHLLFPEMIRKEYNYDRSRELQIIRSEQKDLKAIYFCGHSLGGAMAFLAGLHLAAIYPDLFKKVRGVYTYGAPMVVDDHNRDECENLCGNINFRHVFYNDIVPHWPPLSTGSFDHVGREYRYHPRTKWQLRTLGCGFKSDRCTQVVSLLATAPVGLVDTILDNINWLKFLRGDCYDISFVGAFSRGYLKMPWSLLDHSPIGYTSTLMMLRVDPLPNDDQAQRVLFGLSLTESFSSVCLFMLPFVLKLFVSFFDFMSHQFSQLSRRHGPN